MLNSTRHNRKRMHHNNERKPHNNEREPLTLKLRKRKQEKAHTLKLTRKQEKARAPLHSQSPKGKTGESKRKELFSSKIL